MSLTSAQRRQAAWWCSTLREPGGFVRGHAELLLPLIASSCSEYLAIPRSSPKKIRFLIRTGGHRRLLQCAIVLFFIANGAISPVASGGQDYVKPEFFDQGHNILVILGNIFFLQNIFVPTVGTIIALWSLSNEFGTICCFLWFC